MSRHLNKLRWVTLTTVWMALVLIPMFSLYQGYLAAHAYDLMTPSQKLLYDSMSWLTAPFTEHPDQALDAFKGNVWSGTLFGWRFSDPLAVLGQSAAAGGLYWPFVLTALVPVVLTLIFGRFFCGWICPATLLYELNSNFALWLRRLGVLRGHRHLDTRIKYGVLLVVLLLSAWMGSVVAALIYPPAMISRELYHAVALGWLGVGAVVLLATLLLDLFVDRRAFCRYLCPGGALYSLIGRWRLVRIQRKVERCNDCAKCDAACEFGLRPMRDGFGQECNNCTACMASCPTDALGFVLRMCDQPPQGAGHLGPAFRNRGERQ